MVVSTGVEVGQSRWSILGWRWSTTPAVTGPFIAIRYRGVIEVTRVTEVGGTYDSRFTGLQSVIDRYGHALRGIPEELGRRLVAEDLCLLPAKFTCSRRSTPSLVIVTEREEDLERVLRFAKAEQFETSGVALSCPPLVRSTLSEMMAAAQGPAIAEPSPWALYAEE